MAVPNVGKFIGKGKTEAYETELHNIQTSVMAMLADSTSGNVTSAPQSSGVSDMHAVTGNRHKRNIISERVPDRFEWHLSQIRVHL